MAVYSETESNGVDNEHTEVKPYLLWSTLHIQELVMDSNMVSVGDRVDAAQSSNPNNLDNVVAMQKNKRRKRSNVWEHFDIIATTDAIFDPRYKLQFVEFSYKKLYGVGSPKFSLFKEKMYLLFKEYTKVSTSENEVVASTSTKHSFPNEIDDEMMEEFNALDEEFGLSQQMSQLDRCLEEPRMYVKFN